MLRVQGMPKSLLKPKPKGPKPQTLKEPRDPPPLNPNPSTLGRESKGPRRIIPPEVAYIVGQSGDVGG